jgi:hypothetical protein
MPRENMTLLYKCNIKRQPGEYAENRHEQLFLRSLWFTLCHMVTHIFTGKQDAKLCMSLREKNLKCKTETHGFLFCKLIICLGKEFS